jgi:hypothetical protein
MQLVFIYGRSRRWEADVGPELAALTGFSLFHNHLVVDTLLVVFAFGTPSFVALRGAIWLDVIGEPLSPRFLG